MPKGSQRLEARSPGLPLLLLDQLELEVSAPRADRRRVSPPRYAGTCRDARPPRSAPSHVGGGPPADAALSRARRHASIAVRRPGARSASCFRSDDIGDFVVRRADGSAAFFFSNALDDGAMGVNCVLRGEDHLSNTPRQLLLLEALGLPAPRYGHLALLVGPDGAPLSKRAGAQSVRELRAAGYLPAAILNLLFRLGHSSAEHGLLDLATLARGFDTAHLGRAPARLDPAQLAAWQKEAVQALSPAAAADWLAAALPGTLEPGARADFVAAVRGNVLLPADAALWSRIVFDGPPAPDAAAGEVLREAGAAFFAAAAAAARDHERDWSALVAAVRSATGRKGPALFKPLRCALTGVDHGPELAPLLRLLPAGQAEQRLSRFAH